MKRRQFITLLGSAAGWPLAARAQQGGRIRRVGILLVTVADDPESTRRLAALQGELGRLGWVEGRNLRFETRWTAGDPERIQRAAAELGRSIKYRVIVANFESALRVVRANLAISVVPQEVALPYALAHNLRVIALDEPWAERHFAISFKDEKSLSSAARLLLAHLQMCSEASQTTSAPPTAH